MARERYYLEGVPSFSPLICYEAIFPGSVAVDRDRPAWLLSITNDAWFGSGRWSVAAFRDGPDAGRLKKVSPLSVLRTPESLRWLIRSAKSVIGSI